eukprot:scaffold148175_cov33-Attheya_sp.AAC.1
MMMRIELSRWCRSCDWSALLLVIICQTVCVVTSWSSQSILNTNGKGKANNLSLCNDLTMDCNSGRLGSTLISDDAVAVGVVKGMTSHAHVLVGTSPKFLGLFSDLDPIFSSFLNFRAMVPLDEDDVLLPLPIRELRIALDDKKNAGGNNGTKKQRNTPHDERQ